MGTGDHLGIPIDWVPARPPGPDVLSGERVRLEPLDPDRHGDGLRVAADAGDPRLWDYLAYGPFPDRPSFDAFLRERAAAVDPFYAIVAQRTGAPAGMLAYIRIAPEIGRIEIAHIWFGAALQRTPAATETIWLMARHAFEGLGNRRLEWKCNALNWRSRRAAERFGFTYEGTFRQDMVVKGRNRDTAWFSLLDSEWPAADRAFRTWLAPANFDADGHQRRTLDEIRTTGRKPPARGPARPGPRRDAPGEVSGRS